MTFGRQPLAWLATTYYRYRCAGTWQQPTGTCGTELHADYDGTRGGVELGAGWTEASTSMDSSDTRLEDLPVETLLSAFSVGDIF